MSYFVKETTYTQKNGYDVETHKLKLEYSTVTDAYALYVDDKCVLGGDDSGLWAIENLIDQLNEDLGNNKTNLL